MNKVRKTSNVYEMTARPYAITLPQESLETATTPSKPAIPLLVRSKVFRMLPRRLQRFLVYRIIWAKRHEIAVRSIATFLALIMVLTISAEILKPRIDIERYNLAAVDTLLLPKPNALHASKLVYAEREQRYEFNAGYKPGAGDTVRGLTASPKVSASIETSPQSKNKLSLVDPYHNISLAMTPQYATQAPIQDQNRLVYPISGRDAVKVLTLNSIGVKEDIVLHRFQGDVMRFAYKVGVPEGTEIRMEKDGSLSVYGAQSYLLGNVSTASDKDADLLKNARNNAPKTTLLYRIPPPVIVEAGKKVSEKAEAYYTLDGDQLTLHARNLSQAAYPLSIDPSVYVETAAKLMRGNNETNTDFDIANELIQKSQTTGARIDAWQDNLDMTEGTWDHAVAAAGGYIYRTGGRVDPTKPQVVSSTESLQASDSATFTMNMPANRPAGDLYIALMCHDGSSGGNIAPQGGSGWVEYADLQGHAAYYKIGTNQGGGNEAASYQWTGPSEEWAGIIVRIRNFDTNTPVSGTPGTTSNAGNATPQFPATTPLNDNTLVVRGTGFDQDVPSATGWVPSGHTKLGSNSSSGGGNGSCGYTAASLDTSPNSGVSTGTANHADASVSDDFGASSIAINPAAVVAGVRATVNWAKFNSTTLALESPNPGTGSCSGWCNNTAYNLPEARRGHAMVAYNGYLYVIGGSDGTTRKSTVYIAKLGANGEPQLWHPTDSNKANWVYWYTDAGLSGGVARSYHSAVVYNNRLYVIGGQTNASPGGVTTVEYTDIRPNGLLGSWTTGTPLPAGAGTHMASVQQYNGALYTIGGFEGASTSSANLRSAVYFNDINADGTMNSWIGTTSITTARATFGGNFATIWGAYIYLSGGCTAVNASGYCTTVANDTQIGSINADSSISEWGSINNLINQRMGYVMTSWQGGLYRLGGCAQQNTTNGTCLSVLADVDYGRINPAGEVSTVSITVPSGSAPCNGTAPYNCDLPPPGDDAGEGGQMLSMSTILNGYLYNIGGCIAYTCTGADAGTGDDTDITGNISYASIDSSGRLTAPSSCSGTSYGAWCVDATNRVNGTVGVAAAGIATFNNRIYLVGGIDNTTDGVTAIYYNTTNSDGSFSGAWSTTTFASAGITGELAYTFAYARANPLSAGSNPGNLFIFGGCGAVGSGAGCSNVYRTQVYKCNISTSGSVSGCTTTGQLQIDSELADEPDQGLGLHSGTVYANYIYLIGGYSDNVADRDTVFYARFDNNNNVVSVTTGAAGGNADDWILSNRTLSVGRRRGWAFGYNGHVYSVGGYDSSGTGIIPFIEWSKMNVSDGSIEPFVTSSVTINQRWGLTMVVSNSYAYVIGGCDVGTSPSGCTSFENSIQTFQLYNNDSGAFNNFSTQTDQTFTTDTDRWGASATVLNGYLYVAGGCISTTDCTNATNSVQYAPLSASDGSVGTWIAGGNLPADRAWGSLESAGGTLYYIGGHDDSSANEQTSVYYTSSIASGNPTWNASAATNGLPGARARFGSAVWNNRIYIVGGLDGGGAATNTVYVSPQLNSGGNITSAWTTSNGFNVARSGTAVTSYANNLYLFGGFDGTNYLSDSQFTQINSDGSVDPWSYSTSLPGPLRDAQAISANGYIYIVGGRTSAASCQPNVLITPISANTTIASGNNPTGIGEWYETNVRYTGGRYGAALAYDRGKAYLMGGGCTAPIGPNYTAGTIQQTGRTVTGTGTAWTDDLIGATITYADLSTATVTSVNSATQMIVSVSKTVVAGSSYTLSQNRHFLGTVKSQPQVAQYSRLIDTDSNVFPNSWLLNGVDNSIGARWQASYRSAIDASNIIFTESFDGGTNGSTVTELNTQYDNCYTTGSATGQFSNAQFITAGLSWRPYVPAGNGTAACYDSYSATTVRYDRFYMRIDSGGPSANTTLINWRNGTAGDEVVASIQLSTTRQLRIRDKSTNQITSTALAADTWHRIETAIYGDRLYIRTFEGANLHGTAPTQSYDIPLNLATVNDFTYTNFGIIEAVNAPWGLYIDEHRASSSNWVGPAYPNWGQNTNYGNVTLGDVMPYVPKDAGGANTQFARWYYFFINIDASKTFGYPEDVTRGPTITDLSLFFTADPSKRMRHGKTFTGGEQQPLDTPCRQSVDPDCPLP